MPHHQMGTSMASLSPVPMEVCSDLRSREFDGVVAVASSVEAVPSEEIKWALKVNCQNN